MSKRSIAQETADASLDVIWLRFVLSALGWVLVGFLIGWLDMLLALCVIMLVQVVITIDTMIRRRQRRAEAERTAVRLIEAVRTAAEQVGPPREQC